MNRQPAVFEKAAQPLPLIARIPNTIRDRRVIEDMIALRVTPIEEALDDWARSFLSEPLAFLPPRIRRLRRQRLLELVGLRSATDEASLDALVADGVSGETRAELAQLDRALLRLPVEQRLAWMLRYVEGAELDDVARACGCSLATAKRRIAAADTHVRLHVRLKEVEW